MRTGAHPRITSADVLVGAGFVAAWAVEAVVRDGAEPSRLGSELPGALLLGVMVLRRSRPLLTVTLLAAVFMASSVREWQTGQRPSDAVVPVVALLVALFALGAHGSRAALAPGAFLTVATVVVVDAAGAGGSSYSLASGVAFFAIFVVGLPILAGQLLRGRDVLIGQLRDQQRQLAEERPAMMSAALIEERLQLTGRLHESLVQGTQRLVADVGRARSGHAADRLAAVADVESTARALLAQTRCVVVTLAADDREPDRATASSDLEAAHRRARSGAALPWTALAAAALCVGLLVEVRAAPVRVPMVLALMACLVVAAPLAAAWKSPVVATMGTWAAAAVFAVVVTPLTGMLSPIGLVVLTPFFVAALADRRQSCIGLTVCCLGLVAAFGLSAFPRDLPLLLLAWGAGRVLGERTRLVGQLEATSALLVEQRATALRQAVLDERARVAGDLHDAVGHRLTVLALHAAAVRRMWNSDHGRAEAALATIAEVAEAALAELRQGLVNPEAEGSRAFPLSAVRALVNGARAAGLPVDIRTVDTARELVAVHPAAYRLLQEALTNVLRHAPGAAVRVTLRCSAGRLDVSVENTPGADPTRKGDSGGSGLTGMRRRVESCGGRLTWGCRPDGGFAVHADLPSATVPS